MAWVCPSSLFTMSGVISPPITSLIPIWSRPSSALCVSGGNTLIVDVEGLHPTWRCWALARDDAAGECFDKVARVLGIGYPGGGADGSSGPGRTDDRKYVSCPAAKVDRRATGLCRSPG